MSIPEYETWYVEPMSGDRTEVQGADGRCLAVMADGSDIDNANRMAAAPELSAACRAAYTALAGYRDVLAEVGGESDIPDLAELIQKLRAAILSDQGRISGHAH